MASTTPQLLTLSNDRATRAQALRAAMVERARRHAGDALADFGAMWASYSDRVEQGEPVHRAAITLFAPAAQPKYLVSATFVASSAFSDEALLVIGRDALSIAMAR